ncbi:MAG: hypothetical protein AMXMBFR84_18530 [Candidatus Hydrogenedentota bacterium]
MPDDMFFSPDRRSLRRGKRVAPRTETCRPCVLWAGGEPEVLFRGVIVDVSPYGMRVRMLDCLPVGTEIHVQMMRDDDFQEPMSGPVIGTIVRAFEEEAGFLDHGVQLMREEFGRRNAKAIRIERKKPVQPIHETSRMYTIDLHVGGRGPRR